MEDVLAVSLKGMQIDMLQMERTGMNMVNTVTPGYKRDVVNVRPFSQYISEVNENAEAGSVSIVPDFKHGTLKNTNRSLDMAISGEGFFELKSPQGLVYSRKGNFHIDGAGNLVSEQGYPVMTSKGEISLDTSNILVDKQGNIFDKSTQQSPLSQSIAQIKLVKFENLKNVKRVEGGNFQSIDPGVNLSDSEIQVQQGYLENSNASSAQEMIQLMKTVRHFESMQKMAQGYDEMLGTAIRKLGDI